jgi:3-oxoacyl-[acyl-carrier-protein] synthase-3
MKTENWVKYNLGQLKMNDMCVSAISSYVPKKRRDNLTLIKAHSIENEFLDNKIGVRVLPIKEDKQETSDLAANAVQSLIDSEGIEPKNIDCLIVCTQNPDNFGLPHVSTIVHEKLDLSTNCATFDISLGCSGFVYGVSIARSFSYENNFKNTVFVTADPYSKVVDQSDKNTTLLFGDAAAAVLIQKESEVIGKKLLFGRSSFVSESKKYNALKVEASRTLSMNGRDVFNFAATIVPPQVISLLESHQLDKEDISKYFFHQGSKYILDTLAKRLALSEAQLYSNLHKYGNTVSSTIPLMLCDTWDGLRKGDNLIICGFGVGLSSSCSLVTVG